jgi:hypothetical protein
LGFIFAISLDRFEVRSMAESGLFLILFCIQIFKKVCLRGKDNFNVLILGSPESLGTLFTRPFRDADSEGNLSLVFRFHGLYWGAKDKISIYIVKVNFKNS